MDRHVLKGQAILLVEEQEQPDTARNLESALERFGTEVVPPQRAVEAIERLEEFDFSLASLDWSPDSSEHSAVARRLKEEGARFLFCPKQLPEEVPTRRGASSSQRPPHPRRSSNPPRSLPTRRNRSKRCTWARRAPDKNRDQLDKLYAARVGRGYVGIPRSGTTGAMKGTIGPMQGRSELGSRIKCTLAYHLRTWAAVHLVAWCNGVTRVRETSQSCKRTRAASGAVQLEVQRIELWAYSRSPLTSAGAPLRVLSGGCPYSAREFAKTYS